MAKRNSFAPAEFYHLYNRGTEKRAIFTSKSDYYRFISLLYLSNSSIPVHISNYQGRTLMELLALEKGDPLVEIVAYCLMPNHFHLLLREKSEKGISRFMQKLSTGYTMYFNTRYERTGSLFQGRFKSSRAHNDRYLKYLLSYIHLNPAKIVEPKWREAGVVNKKSIEQFLESYTYSSFLDYAGKDRVEKTILTREALPEYFDSPESFKKEVFEWLEYGQEVNPARLNLDIKVQPR